MKITINHLGNNAHSIVMAILQGESFTLNDGVRDWRVRPNINKEGFSLKKESEYSDNMKMIVPVELGSLGEALMAFDYTVKKVVVAEALASVEEVLGTDAVAGLTVNESSCYEEETGIRFGSLGQNDPKPQIVGDVLIGARIFPATRGHPAIASRPEVVREEFSAITFTFE